ncbi:MULTISPECIES: lipid II flippase MurJ [unclassified Ornithinimicrobium]|uniref:lipid II flippase MurJ n=1 Tax=unclassified Ornithinimicrobium TaxID=2615080 RepID=UPI003854C61B
MTGSSSASLASSSLVMASGTLVSRALGLLRVSLLVAAIGLGNPALDIWQAANTLPNTIYVLLAAGVLNVVLLPQLMRAMVRGEEGKDYTDRLLTLALAVLVGGTVLFVAATPLITKLYNLSMPWGSPELTLTIMFAYLCVPQVLFYGVHTLLGQVLAAHHRFAAFMWSPALANVVAISGILLFMRLYPEAGRIGLQEWTPAMIWLLAGSATLGIVVQAVVLVPAVRRTGFRWAPRWGFRGVGLGSASRMAGWSIADIALSQAGLLLVFNLLAWVVVRGRETGESFPARAAYDNAYLIFILPHSLIALSLLTAIYPVLSRAAAEHDLSGMAQHTARGLRLLATAMVPVSLAMVLFAPYVVRIIFPRNADPQAMAPILMVLSLGLVPYGLYLLCARVFYSFEDARTPFGFQIAITTVLVLVLAVTLTQPPSRAALLVAVGQALGQTTAAVLALRAVRRRLPGIDLRGVVVTLGRAALAAVVAAVPVLVLLALLPGAALSQEDAQVGAWLGSVLTVALCGLLYLLGYAVLAHRLGVAELAEAAAPLLRRLPGGRALAAAVPAPEDGAPRVAQGAGGPEEGTLGWDDARTGRDGSGKDREMDRLEVGTRLGERYALDELLARREGGTLDYWSARDVTLGRLVAVTVLPSTGDNAQVAQAVIDGARRVAAVDDPRLVRVLDVGQEEGLCWIVEEGLSEAESLASLVSEGPLPAEEARRIVGEAAAGLESARRRGLHHLYLNPHSVLRTSDGTVKISGVGVASALEGTDDVTAVEASLIDTADLVSLLYTGLTGRWPGEELPGLRSAHRLYDGSLPAPSELVGGVPGDLDALCRAVDGPAADADSGVAPHTPGEVARQLAPWSSEMVRSTRPASLAAPRTAAPDEATTGALSAHAGASAAAIAAHPADTEHPADTGREDVVGVSGTGSHADPDRTTVVPRPPRDGVPQTDPLAGVRPGSGPTDDRADARTRPTTADLLGVHSTGDRPSSRPARPGAEPVTAGPGTGGGAGGGGGVTAGQGLAEERGTGAQTAVVMLVLLGLLGVAVVLGWSALRGLTGGDDPGGADGSPGVSAPTDGSSATAGDDATGEDSTSETGGATSAPEPSSPDAPAADGDGATAVLGITSFDPQGDGDENNDLTPLAVDGDPDTAWTSHTYLSTGWGGLKTGTGLVLDLGEGATVSEVAVQLGEGDVGGAVYLSDQVGLDGATQLGSADSATETWTVTPDEPVTGRYLIVWFTRAWTSPDGEVVSVREITVG